MSHAQTGVKAESKLQPLKNMARALCLWAALLGCAEPPLGGKWSRLVSPPRQKAQ